MTRSASAVDDRCPPSPRIATGWLLAGIVLIAAGLRAPITSVGPLVDTIRADVGIDGTGAGVLTTLPVLAFAAMSPLAPRLGRRLGLERALLLALLGLLVGLAVRSVPTLPTLFAGTVLLGAAIAVANVLLPGLVKRDFRDRVSVITSGYVATMNIVAALSSGVAVPVADAAPGGWRTAIGGWAVLALAATALWSRQLRPAATGTSAPIAPLPWRSPLAWAVTVFMGVQSFAFYALVNWLPSILTSHGMGRSAAGWTLFGYQVVALLSVFTVPLLIRRLADQRLLTASWSALAVLAALGLLLAPGLALLWVTLAGLASGASLLLALTFFGLRAVGAEQAAALSGMAQSVGYLIAAAGPLLFGALHQATGGWRTPLAVLVAVGLVQLTVGYRAGRADTVTARRRSAAAPGG